MSSPSRRSSLRPMERKCYGGAARKSEPFGPGEEVMRKLFVKNLHPSTTGLERTLLCSESEGEISSPISEYELLQFFQQFGPVESYQLARDPRSVVARVEKPDCQLQER